MRKTKEQKGITLIALIITIIVLLILAGVALSTLTGDSGILNNAESAKGKTNLANAKEQVAMAIQGALTEAYAKGEKTIAREQLKNELESIVGTENKDYTLTEGESPWTVKVGEYEATVYSNGKVEPNENPGSGNGGEGTGGNIAVPEFRIYAKEGNINNLEVDGTIQLMAFAGAMYGEITEVEWSSSNPEVATIDDKGVVTGVNASKGTTIITARSTKDNKVSATKEITVNPKVIGDCENEKCNNGWVILGRKCPNCGTTNKNVKSESDESGDRWIFEDCGHTSSSDGENVEEVCENCQGSGKSYDYGN